LDVEDRPGLARALVSRRIIDCPNGEEGRLPSAVAFVFQRAISHRVQPTEINTDSEIDPDLAYRVAEILELKGLVAAGVADNDESAASADHLVKAEILEVPAVREIDVVPVVGRLTEHLVQQRGNCHTRAFAAVDF